MTNYTKYRKPGLKYRYVLTTIRTGSHLFFNSLISSLKLNIPVKTIYLKPFEHDYYINNKFYINRIHTPSFVNLDIENEPDLKVILLDRKDHLEQAISFYIADYLKQHNLFWKFQLKNKVELSQYQKTMNSNTILFDRNRIKHIIQEWENNRINFYTFVQKNNIPYKVFYYEDFIPNFEQTLKEAITFLFDYTFEKIDSNFSLYKTSTKWNKLFKLYYESLEK